MESIFVNWWVLVHLLSLSWLSLVSWSLLTLFCCESNGTGSIPFWYRLHSGPLFGSASSLPATLAEDVFSFCSFFLSSDKGVLSSFLSIIMAAYALVKNLGGNTTSPLLSSLP